MTGPSRAGRTSLLIAAVIALTGLVWLAQGLGAPIGRSFMIGDPFWALAGAGLVVVAAALGWRAVRRP
jgi:hypothetical protein